MDYCGPQGIPHSVFLKWKEEDQDKALAWVVHNRLKCGRCGTVTSDWLDEAGMDREPPPYVAVTELCVGCQILKDRIGEIPEEMRSQYHVFLVPREVADGNPRRTGRQNSPSG